MFLDILLIILATIGAIVVLVILGLFALRWYLLWRLRRFGEQFAENLQSLADSMAVAVDFAIRRVDENPLAEDGEANQAVAALTGRGFVDAGYYTIGGGMGGGVGLASSEHAAYAIVYRFGEHLVIDIVTPYADDTWFTLSTAPETGMQRPPDMPIVRLRGVTADQLFEQFLAQRPGKPFRRVRADLFEETVREYLKKEQEWRGEQPSLESDG